MDEKENKGKFRGIRPLISLFLSIHFLGRRGGGGGREKNRYLLKLKE